ncbi:conserved protein of unknown function [Pseudomonas marincola]|uniref:Uncharacterized protein n=1 Tax=Pseudomonas marincola TaxID=437900 RepID=A0A653DZ51_9PSED|nr:conserved protein of unknown function [Pseudomonas marincola]
MSCCLTMRRLDWRRHISRRIWPRRSGRRWRGGTGQGMDDHKGWICHRGLSGLFDSIKWALGAEGRSIWARCGWPDCAHKVVLLGAYSWGVWEVD